MFKKMISVFVVMWLITFIFVSLSWAENFNVELVGSWQPSDSQGNIDIIKVFGDYAYLGTDQGLCILKVTDPAHPVAVGFCPTIGYVNDIALQGEYVYVASSKPPQGVPGSLRVINISDPQNPYEAGHFDFIDCMEAFNVCIKDHYAYVLTQNLDLVNVKIYTVDIVLPADPHAIGFYSLTDIDRGDIWIEDHYLYITAGYSLLVLDISNPENIHEIGSYIADEYLFKIYMQDHYAYVTQDFSYLIIDIATPFEPKLVTKNIVPFTSSTPLNICVLGDYAYFTHGDLGISILNVANPSSQVAGHYDTPALARDICADSEYIYIADSRFLNAKSSLLVLKFTPNLPAEKPVNLSPPNGTQDTTTLITLRTSGFSDPDNSAHKASQWRVFNSSNVVVFDSGTDAKNLVKITLPQGALNYDATYAWQVRYQDDHNMWSEWSEKTSFSTMPRERFSFVQVTDAHIGGEVGKWQLSPDFIWDAPLDTIMHLRETTACYVNFLDTLRAVISLNPKPDFILITGDNVDWANEANLQSFKNILSNPYFKVDCFVKTEILGG